MNGRFISVEVWEESWIFAFSAASKIEERLRKQSESDVSLKIEPNDSESWIVSGRGELHLSILIENMRREGFELQVSKPEVILREVDGKICEPYEDVQIEVPEENVGPVIEALGKRGGTMESMTNLPGLVKLNYIVPSRGLIGFTTDFTYRQKGLHNKLICLRHSMDEVYRILNPRC